MTPYTINTSLCSVLLLVLNKQYKTASTVIDNIIAYDMIYLSPTTLEDIKEKLFLSSIFLLCGEAQHAQTNIKKVRTVISDHIMRTNLMAKRLQNHTSKEAIGDFYKLPDLCLDNIIRDLV